MEILAETRPSLEVQELGCWQPHQLFPVPAQSEIGKGEPTVGDRSANLNPAQSRISSDNQSRQTCLADGSRNECSVRGLKPIMNLTAGSFST